MQRTTSLPRKLTVAKGAISTERIFFSKSALRKIERELTYSMFMLKKYLAPLKIMMMAISKILPTADGFYTTPNNHITPAYFLIEAKLDH